MLNPPSSAPYLYLIGRLACKPAAALTLSWASLSASRLWKITGFGHKSEISKTSNKSMPPEFRPKISKPHFVM